MIKTDNALPSSGISDQALLPLVRELDVWRDSGLTATFWWRDDDAVAPSAALDRLLRLCGTAGTTPALAVIPYPVDSALADRLVDEAVMVVQHGVAHVNNAGSGAKKTELTVTGTFELLKLKELLKVSATKLDRLFHNKFKRILVPPWNRIDTKIVALLPDLGYRGLSTFAPRAEKCPAPGLLQVNCHVDPVDWRSAAGDADTRTGLSPESVIRTAAAHLEARRTGDADVNEPTGILSHHLVHDDSTWALLEALATVISSHPAACWLDPKSVFTE